jgi:hypothetical protein
MIFKAEDLVADWTKFAILRNVDWSWSGDTYNCSARAKVADQASLALHAGPLSSLLKHAPSGFPAFSSLRDCIESLQKEHNILQVDKKFAARACSLAAEGWKAMCKHIYNLKVNNTVCENDKVAALVVLVRLDPAEASAPAEAPAPAHEPRVLDSAADVLAMFPQDEAEVISDAEMIASSQESVVILCGASAAPEIPSAPDLEIPSAPNIEIPSAARGGQRDHSSAWVRRRLKGKQSRP